LRAGRKDGDVMTIGKLILAALALLIPSATAQADRLVLDAIASYEAITYPMLAQFLGNQKHNRCPRFKVIDEATRAELATVTWDDRELTAADLNDPGGEQVIEGFIEKYATDPSAFCDRSWKLLGPNGTYKRQMLEAR
jgi:hypothetical protein